jgi:acyl-CoA synthetase (AMP-forming)/AMP-acid ligase II
MTPSQNDFPAAFASAIQRWPDREAIVSREDDRVLTYAQLGRLVRGAAARLRQVSPEATGLLIATARPDEIIVAYLAGLTLGLRVAVSTSSGRDEMEAMLGVLGKAVVVPPDGVPPGSAVPHGCAHFAASLWEPETQAVEPPVSDGAALRTADQGRDSRAEVVFFTSGTTGLSKGVLIRGEALVGNAREVAETFEFGHDRHLLLLPLAHTNGQVISLLAPLLSGGAVVVGKQSGLLALFGFWTDVQRLRVDVVDCVPTVITSLLELSERSPPSGYCPRLFITGGASIAPGVIERFEAHFGVTLLQEYGLSETVCVSSCERPGLRRRGSVGKPLRSTDIRVVGEDGAACPSKERGRVVIRTPHRLVGYVTRDGGVQDPAPDGMLMTEDLGYYDEDGFLFIAGRRDDTLIKGGYNIVPDDVERALRDLEGVAECVAFGVPCQVYGQDLVIVIVPTGGTQPGLTQVVEHLKQRGGRMWIPRELVYLDKIPTTMSGKPLRRILVANYLSALGGNST